MKSVPTDFLSSWVVCEKWDFGLGSFDMIKVKKKVVEFFGLVE